MTDIKELKRNFDIVKYLNCKNIEYTEKPTKYIIKSPFREDNKASACIFKGSNVFTDFGGEKLDIVDFIIKLENCDKTNAIKILSGIDFPNGYKATVTIENQTPRIAILHTQDIQNKALIEYLISREISLNTAKECGVKEIYYKAKETQSKPCFALGFQNDKGGFELRSKIFKGSNAPKGITTINNNSDTAVIFEGFFDYLSAQEYFYRKVGYYMPYNIYVLNSVSNLNKLNIAYPFIKCFLDNDTSGINCYQEIKKQHPQAENKSQELFPQFKDFNEFLISQKKELQKS